MARLQLAKDLALPSGGTFGTYASRLRSLELIEGRRDLRASSEFFE